MRKYPIGMPDSFGLHSRYPFVCKVFRDFVCTHIASCTAKVKLIWIEKVLYLRFLGRSFDPEC